MVLALEAEYDDPQWWHQGRFNAEVVSEQEVQPMFTMKDMWDICVCEDPKIDVVVTPYGQRDEQTGEELREYLWCPLTSHGGEVNPYHRYDWRPGRELTEEQASRWAVHHRHLSHAHDIFNGPAKEATVSVHLPAANGISVDGIDISQWITGNVDIQLTEWQRLTLDALPTASVDVSFIPGGLLEGGGNIRVSDGEHFVSVPVAESSMEDRNHLEGIVRATVDRFERWRRERERSRRESGGADSGGPPSEGTAPGGGTSALQA